ncbi:hypothetical protein [Sinomicrobium weinanense]|uniref:Outer membrane protein beta-barrel domain-containing protein n=1 Tax=Sinomicrobium weinanense TaxID=2842200 RepID=A0A926JVP0_9FLAO|nr:hypothetical protein [Sinomicrobium weinanense]MBC9798048.1 hypothetical protein [Sinomicrobium weinanense]MBU3124860.1 hypothetical protein [Sinomicrobium weinanense]
MLRIIMYVIYMTVLLTAQFLWSQSDRDSLDIRRKERVLEGLESEKERVVKEEKAKLKKEVERIRKMEDAGEITEEEAGKMKEEEAKKTALNIENKLAILENKLALVKRGEENGWEYLGGTTLGIGIGNTYDNNGSRLFGIQFENRDKEKKYDKKTTSGIVVAFGFNNALVDGESLNDSPYKAGGSRFFEFGWQWKTRIFKNSNAMRVSYGLSFQSNSLKPKDNRYFMTDGKVTSLEEFPYDLKKSKLRFDNLVLPVFLEFGPSRKIEREDYFRYSTRKKFAFGIGGYAGVNLATKQKLKYSVDGDRRKEKLKENYNTNDFIYGLAAYIGRGATSLYLKYDLNPIFKDPNVKQNNISLGLRFEL